MSEPHVILASGSPRRSEILTRIGVPHTIQIPNVDESTIENETIQEYVIRVALEKYREVERQTLPGNWLIAADTMVELDGEWLGKPADANGAIRMLRKMSGRKHTVWTGVVIGETGSDKMKTLCERSDVDFMPLSESEINKYVSGGEPLDKLVRMVCKVKAHVTFGRLMVVFLT